MPKPKLEDYRPSQHRPIREIEGIGDEYKEKLEAVGIESTLDLLKMGRTRQGRRKLAEDTGISGKLILEWVNLADLFRISGVEEEYSDLLEEAGVDTVVELSKRVAENLYEKMKEVNEEKKLVRRLPPLTWLRTGSKKQKPCRASSNTSALPFLEK